MFSLEIFININLFVSIKYVKLFENRITMFVLEKTLMHVGGINRRCHGNEETYKVIAYQELNVSRCIIRARKTIKKMLPKLVA